MGSYIPTIEGHRAQLLKLLLKILHRFQLPTHTGSSVNAQRLHHRDGHGLNSGLKDSRLLLLPITAHMVPVPNLAGVLQPLL